jgi:hypothetical protein
LVVHPQFLLTSLTVNPDALINLCGAFVWWQTAILYRTGGWRGGLAAVLMVGAAAIAVFSKRNGVPLIVISLLVIASDLSVRMYRRSRWSLIVAVCLVIAVPLYMLASSRLSLSSVTPWLGSIRVTRSLSSVTFDSVLGFLREAVNSIWLIAGWLLFRAPQIWYAVAYVLTMAGLVGACVALVRQRDERRPLSVAWVFVVVQTLSMWIVAFMGHSHPQGRYLFAAAIPMAVLLSVGLFQLSPAYLRRYAPAAIVATVAILDLTGLVFVLLPAYQ